MEIKKEELTGKKERTVQRKKRDKEEGRKEER